MEIQKVWFDDENIYIKTKEQIEKSMPLNWFPKLKNASDEQRLNFELSPFGIHWHSLDEDLSFEGFFKFNKVEMKASN